MSSVPIQRIRGDSFPTITASLTYDKLPIDLTDAATITFSWVDSSGTHQLAGVVTNAIAGEVEFDVLETSFLVAGTWDYDIQVVFNNGKKGTFKIGKITVLNDINKG